MVINMINETVIRKDIRDEITLEVEMYTTANKKDKRAVFATLEKLDVLQYHYFAQEYDALKACYITSLCYVKYRKHRYLAGVIAWHVSSMNKILRNVFFGSEMFGHFRKYMIDTYNVKAKFITISRFVLFPQFRGIGMASKFVDMAVRQIEPQKDILMMEIYSSMLYNYDFMPDDWVRYVNVAQKSFPTFYDYTMFCQRTGIVRGLEDAKKVLNRALKRVDDGGRIRAADLPCAQVQSQAVRMVQASGVDGDLLDKLTNMKRNQSFRNAKQIYKRTGRSEKYIQRKSQSMYNRMSDAESFVNIASYMFYIPEDRFKYFNEYYCLDSMINYNSVLDSYTDFCDIFIQKMAGYKKNRKKQLPIFVEMFKECCDVQKYKNRDQALQKATSQQVLTMQKEIDGLEEIEM